MASASSLVPTATDRGPLAPSEASERARAREVAAIPGWYSPYLHLAGTTGIGIVTLVLAVTSLHQVRPLELLALPATFLLSNGVEWRAHKYVLHRRFWPVGVLYDKHTPVHHKIYQYDSMAIRSNKEFRLVLIPAAGVASMVAITAPFAYLVSRLFSPNCGWLALATSAVYVVAYELSHLAYHLPEDSLIGRMSLVRVLREHHRRHHHPTLMQTWNFNVTVPLFDWLHRTIASDALVERTVEASRRRAQK